MSRGKAIMRRISTVLLVMMLSISMLSISGSFLQVVHAAQAPVLDSLSLSGITLSPAFDPNTTSYTATVDYSLNSTTVTAGTSSSGITVNPADLGTKSLVPGKNKLTVSLTDGTSTLNTYTITIDKFVRLDERDPNITYSAISGNWTLTNGQGDYNATLSAHNVAGNYTEYTGFFSRVILGTRMGPGAGIADVYLDGTFVKEVDLYKSSVTYKLTMYDSGNITPGQHTIRMVATGNKNSKATSAYANFDYIDYMPSVSSIQVSSQSGVSMIHTKEGSLQLEANVFPADAAVERLVNWKVYDGAGSDKVSPSTRATISPTGLLTAKDDGTVTVLAAAKDGSEVVSNEFTVQISGQNGAGVIPVSSISVSSGDAESIIPSKGGTLQMVADVSPSDATDASVNWSVTNGTGSATIDANGLLTAVSKGTVTVKAVSKDGSGVGSNEYTVAIAYPQTTFNNPIKINRGGDPYVLMADDGYYYMIVTEGAGKNNRITLRRSQSMAGISYGEQKVVFTMPAAENDVWAGEINQLGGKWYIYYNSTRSGDTGRRMHVLECADTDPMTGTWTYKGQVSDAANENAIDGDVFEVNGDLYMLWSGKYDATRTPSDIQRIYIAHMSNPWTIDSARVMISEPTEEWERRGQPVDEGPIALIRNGKVYVTFSGSFYQTNYYCLGLLTANQNDDLLNPASWIKTGPVFTGSIADGVVSTGHNGFFPSVDGTEDWFVYHSVSSLNQVPNERDVRMQKITWDGDVPNFGVPVSNTTELPLPSGEAASDKYEAENATLLGSTMFTSSNPDDYDGFTGIGYVNYQHAAGDSVTFQVVATATGTYPISFRYSNGAVDSKVMKLTVNDTVVDDGIAFPTTSNGNDAKGVPYINYSLVGKDVTLHRGANTITLESNGSSGLRLDSLIVPELGGGEVVSAQEVANGIASIAAPDNNAAALTLPAVPEGFTVTIKSSSNPAVIQTNGTIIPPDEETTVNLILEITRTADGSTAETGVIPVLVSASAKGPQASLTGMDSVIAGNSFDMTYELNNVTGRVYAQDLTVIFDPEKVEFVSAESIKDGFIIVDKKETKGELRIIAAGMGEGAIPLGGLMKLHWKAKPLTESSTTSIGITSIVIADELGAETQVDDTSHDIAIMFVDKTALHARISEAEQIHDAAVEGSNAGQYPSGSKASLQTAIDSAVAVAVNPAATEDEVQAAEEQLNEALQAFNDSVITRTPGDQNQDGRVSVGDLALAAKYYGKTANDADWEQCKFADLNDDGKIDITDLAMLARMILNWS
ncbi:family 43 glycosylhydrolase [Paenibacillus hexagrammi]|uniref:Family 43 glycosylhydrolase n=1 Tax=Paenibacillus hexagrammi TaxID=2908839 RepID=A0ABY3SMR9_9BACL|nr:family 43 glycosylhydrolase [Paenibacillus sp. YPD9-1]UJF35193.1 family 43 glycosylhydrolase [Paenibacillus sp. YPD9-1]